MGNYRRLKWMRHRTCFRHRTRTAIFWAWNRAIESIKYHFLKKELCWRNRQLWAPRQYFAIIKIFEGNLFDIIPSWATLTAALTESTIVESIQQLKQELGWKKKPRQDKQEKRWNIYFWMDVNGILKNCQEDLMDSSSNDAFNMEKALTTESWKSSPNNWHNWIFETRTLLKISPAIIWVPVKLESWNHARQFDWIKVDCRSDRPPRIRYHFKLFSILYRDVKFFFWLGNSIWQFWHMNWIYRSPDSLALEKYWSSISMRNSIRTIPPPFWLNSS